MALIIDERLAGGRPQKNTAPPAKGRGAVAARLINAMFIARTVERDEPARPRLTWVRA